MVIISPFGNLAYDTFSYFGSPTSGVDAVPGAASAEPEEAPQATDLGNALQFAEDPIDPAAIDDGTYQVSLPALSTGTLDEPLSNGDSADALVDEFRAWADMTLAERIRAQYLKDHDLTEEDLKLMGEDVRNTILASIESEIERQLAPPKAEHAVADLMQILGVDKTAPVSVNG